MEHLGTNMLETERLILRKFTINDADDMYRNWASDLEVTKFLRWNAHDSVDISRQIINAWVDNYKKDDFYQWAIALKKSNELIGTISVVDENRLVNMVHIGYCIGRKWWNRGYTSEALGRILQFFFEEVKVNRVESQHDPNNPGSGKVMLKCGLKYEGTHRQADWSNQGICDASMYGILASDYFKD